VTILFDGSFRDRARDNVARFERRAIDDDGLIRAAVAMTLVPDDDGKACFVLTRRPLNLRRHAGQWALPGGRGDAGESSVSTASRELREEVGLALPDSACLGLLDDFRTRSGFVITPVVFDGVERPTLVPDPSEVHAAYLVPFEVLETPDIPRLLSNDHGEHPLICLPVEHLGTTIWAPTAALIYQMREVVLHGRQTRVAHYEQPRFAWK